MKTNAIVRIVLWSLVILVLAGILLAGLGIGSFLTFNRFPLRTDASVNPIVASSPGAFLTGTVTKSMNIRKTPSPMSENIGMVEAGTTVTLSRQELVDGHTWGYVTDPITGWMVLDYFQPDDAESPLATDPAAPDTPTSPLPEGAYSASAADIKAISIAWASGDILITAADVEDIRFWETGTDADAQPMVWEVRNGKLSIEYSQSVGIQGFGLNVSFSKDLTIQVPKDWVCRELELAAASATLTAQSLTLQEADIDTASGACLFEDCQVDELDVETASGNVDFSGTLNTLECDAASASFEAVLANVPKSIEMDSASGDLKLTLPEDAGFTASVEGLNSKFTSDFDTTSRNGNYVHGNGYCRIEMDAMSGSVTIHKAPAA